MFLQKIRAFFEWLGKRSTAKSRKALDYEWTTMSPDGGTPVKTVDLGESDKTQGSVPVKSVDIGDEKPVEVKVAQTEKPVQAESAFENGDVEARMAVILKAFTIRDAVNLLQQKFERAADVRRSRVALLAFLQQTPEAVLFLEERVKEKKAAVKKPAVRKSNVKKTTSKKSAGTKTAGKRTAAKKTAVQKPGTKKQAEQTSSQPAEADSAAADAGSKQE